MSSNKNHRTPEQKKYDVGRICTIANSHTRDALTRLYDKQATGLYSLEAIFADGEIKRFGITLKRRILDDSGQSTPKETDRYARNIEQELSESIVNLLDSDSCFHGSVGCEVAMMGGRILNAEVFETLRINVPLNDEFRKN